MASDITDMVSTLSVTDQFVGPAQCPKCNELFDSHQILQWHQKGHGHFLCNECGQLFHDPAALEAHQKEDHRPDQNLLCPGCGQTFVRAAAWIQHVEKGTCTGIFPSDIANRREKHLKFGLELSKRTKVDDAFDWNAAHQPSDPWFESTDTTTVEFKAAKPSDSGRYNDRYNAHRVYFHPDDFPRLEKQKCGAPASRSTTNRGSSEDKDDTGTREEKPANAWSQKKNLFPKSYNAVPPPAELLNEMRKPGPLAQPVKKRIFDPNSPDFNASVYYNSLLRVFQCPHKFCNAKAKTASGLVSHLNSEAHSDTELMCPTCLKMFKSVTSWVAHTETSKKCFIRETADYRPALNQATGGALDVDPWETLRYETSKFRIDKTFMKEMRNPTTGPMTGLEVKEKQRIAAEIKQKEDYWKVREPQW